MAVSLTMTDEAIELKVADDGPGIPVAEREHIFERFRRVPGMDEPGSGLGLAITQRAASLHDGTIAIEDGINGRGTTVVVRLRCR